MYRRTLAVLTLGAAAVLALPAFAQDEKKEANKDAQQAAAQEKPDGYTDTPMQPNGKWHVHDPNRPQPQIVTPGRQFSQMADAPSDATVLFDGKDFSRWQSDRGGDVKWKLENGYMETTSTGTIRTKDEFGDFQLHLEFATPSQVSGKGQGRGNNGVNIYGMYEIQVLDSYNNKTYPDGQASAIYGQYPPLVNASRPPGEWQTYDIIWETPRWDEGGKLVKKARATVLHNGLVVHHDRELFGRTGHKMYGKYERPHPPKGFIQLYEHGNPVRFRNIWIRPIVLDDAQQGSGGAAGQAAAADRPAEGGAKKQVMAAAKKLADAGGYAWHAETDFRGGGGGNRFGGPTDGKAGKDGVTMLTLTRGDNTIEAVLKGEKGAVKTEEGWKSFEELRQAADDGGGFGSPANRRRFLGRQLQAFKAPAAEAQDLANKAKELKKDGDAYAGDLTEEGVKELMTFRGGRGGNANFNPPAPTNTSGSVKFWVKDGVLSKYEYTVKGTMSFNNNEFEVDRTTTVEIKDAGNTKVDVPQEAQGKVS